MTCIIANTIAEGKHYANNNGYADASVISTEDNIRGRRFGSDDSVIILTNKPKINEVLLPALQGAHVYFDIHYRQ